MLHEIQEAGLGCQFYEYVRSFLRARTTTLKAEDLISHTYDLGTHGTPQGSVLLSFLFNLALRKILKMLKHIEGVEHTF